MQPLSPKVGHASSRDWLYPALILINTLNGPGFVVLAEAGRQAGALGAVLLVAAFALLATFSARRACAVAREAEAHKIEGVGIVHDTAVRNSAVPGFIAAADEMSARLFPQARVLVVSHLGDGNVHYNIACLDPDAREGFMAKAGGSKRRAAPNARSAAATPRLRERR